jgi:hypothetical protein
LKTAAQHNADFVGTCVYRPHRDKTAILVDFFASKGVKVRVRKVKGWERKPGRRKIK